MSVPETDVARLRRFADGQVPAHVRDQLRYEVTTRGDSMTLVECRPPWDDDEGEWHRMPVAQFRRDAAEGTWTLRWADRNGRWLAYPDLEPTADLDRLIREIGDDPHCVFFG